MQFFFLQYGSDQVVALNLLQCLFMFEKRVQNGIHVFSLFFATILFTLYFWLIPDETYLVTTKTVKSKIVIVMMCVVLVQGLGYYYTKISNKLFDDLKRYSEDVDSQAQEKETFFACMSHEIRNPIQSILGALELLLPGVGKSKEDKRLVRIAKNGCEMVLNLVSNILDLSKIHANKMELSFSPCSLRETVLKILRLNKEKAEGKGLFLRFVDSPDLPPALELDAKKLSQVILNIVSNAIKFTQVGGVTVKLSWNWNENQMVEEESVPEDEPVPNALSKKYSLELSGSRRVKKSPSFVLEDYSQSNRSYLGSQGTATIEVRDTGIGIRQESIPRLFQAFNQADASISKQNYESIKEQSLWRNRTWTLDFQEYSPAYERRYNRTFYMWHNQLKQQVESTYGQGSKFIITFPAKVCPESKLVSGEGLALMNTFTFLEGIPSVLIYYRQEVPSLG
eukprot:TRINITY_DN30_c0_g2_i3.p1 TRINITY_DN30_c0_g2~~TRINITY_DN30_c0_g2_i3.p1  ORF type:complete len:452 (+),score=16.21 TRINITY_DN30_c0_g2_i3:526-1881(+)